MTKRKNNYKKYEELTEKINELETKQNKNNKKKKLKIIVGCGIGCLFLSGVIATCIIVSKNETNYIWTFTQNDYINFKKNIINEINENKLTFDDLKTNILNYSKKYLTASNKNASSIIENILNLKIIGDNISFEIILNNTRNNQYVCEKINNFYLLENKLFIKILGIKLANKNN